MNNLSIKSIITNRTFSKHHFTQLYALCRLLKPHIIVETGVGLGISSIFILQAIQDNGFGELYSIDLPRAVYNSDAGIKINESSYTSQENIPGCLIPEDLRESWTLLLGKSIEKLPKLCERLGLIDLFFHDSEHTYHNMMSEYQIVWPFIRKNGVLASHDIDWNNAFTDFAKKNDCTAVMSRNGFGFVIS